MKVKRVDWVPKDNVRDQHKTESTHGLDLSTHFETFMFEKLDHMDFDQVKSERVDLEAERRPAELSTDELRDKVKAVVAKAESGGMIDENFHEPFIYESTTSKLASFPNFKHKMNYDDLNRRIEETKENDFAKFLLHEFESMIPLDAIDKVKDNDALSRSVYDEELPSRYLIFQQNGRRYAIMNLFSDQYVMSGSRTNMAHVVIFKIQEDKDQITSFNKAKSLAIGKTMLMKDKIYDGEKSSEKLSRHLSDFRINEENLEYFKIMRVADTKSAKMNSSMVGPIEQNKWTIRAKEFHFATGRNQVIGQQIELTLDKNIQLMGIKFIEQYDYEDEFKVDKHEVLIIYKEGAVLTVTPDEPDKLQVKDTDESGDDKEKGGYICFMIATLTKFPELVKKPEEQTNIQKLEYIDFDHHEKLNYRAVFIRKGSHQDLVFQDQVQSSRIALAQQDLKNCDQTLVIQTSADETQNHLLFVKASKQNYRVLPSDSEKLRSHILQYGIQPNVGIVLNRDRRREEVVDMHGIESQGYSEQLFKLALRSAFKKQNAQTDLQTLSNMSVFSSVNYKEQTFTVLMAPTKYYDNWKEYSIENYYEEDLLPKFIVFEIPLSKFYQTELKRNSKSFSNQFNRTLNYKGYDSLPYQTMSQQIADYSLQNSENHGLQKPFLPHCIWCEGDEAMKDVSDLIIKPNYKSITYTKLDNEEDIFFIIEGSQEREESTKKITEIMGKKYDRIRGSSFAFVEDDREERPFVIFKKHEEKDKQPYYKNFTFILLKEGKPVQGSAVRLGTEQTDHPQMVAVSPSSDLMRCYRDYKKYGTLFQSHVNYYQQNYMVATAIGGLINISEIAVKYILDSSEKIKEVKSMLIGRKKILCRDQVHEFNLIPYFSEQSSYEMSSHIVGCTVQLEESCIVLETTQAQFEEDIDSFHEFHSYQSKDHFFSKNRFLNCRIKMLKGLDMEGDSFTEFVAEVQLRQEMIQHLELEECHFLYDNKRQGVNLQLLENALQLLINSKNLTYLPDMIKSPFIQRLSRKDADIHDDMSWLGQTQSLFNPVDCLNGHSVVEYFDVDYAINSQVFKKRTGLTKSTPDKVIESLYKRHYSTFSNFEKYMIQFDATDSALWTKIYNLFESQNVAMPRERLIKENFNFQSTISYVLLETQKSSSRANQLIKVLQASCVPTQEKRKFIMEALFPVLNQEDVVENFSRVEYLEQINNFIADHAEDDDEFVAGSLEPDQKSHVEQPTPHAHFRIAVEDRDLQHEFAGNFYSKAVAYNDLLTNLFSIMFSLKAIKNDQSQNGTNLLQPSYIDFKDYLRAKTVHEILNSKSKDDMKKAVNQEMTEFDLIAFTDQLLNYVEPQHLDSSYMNVVRDLVNHSFKNQEKVGDVLLYMFMFGYLFPLIMQMGFGGYSPVVVYCCCSICIVSQLISQYRELKNLFSRPDTLAYFDNQNIIDQLSIFFSLFYLVLRMTNPKSAVLSEHEKDFKELSEEGNVMNYMPTYHFVVLTLAFAQWYDYLKQTDFLNKYMTLLAKALYDIAGFLVIFILFQIYFMLAFFVSGATFDDGSNHDAEYDTLHNDYPKLDQLYVYAFGVLRSSLGDLQPPSYDYWGGMYDLGIKNYPYFNIALIWFLWFIQILVIVICMLNFLIAIVTDSYEYIKEVEAVQKISRRHDINMNTKYDTVDKGKIDVICFYSELENEGDAQWEGASKSIKKALNKTEKKIYSSINVLQKEIQSLKSTTQTQLDTIHKQLLAQATSGPGDLFLNRRATMSGVDQQDLMRSKSFVAQGAQDPLQKVMLGLKLIGEKLEIRDFQQEVGLETESDVSSNIAE